MNYNSKIEHLKTILLDYKRVGIAFSGGVDSTVLAAYAIAVLGKENVFLFRIDSAMSTFFEKEFAHIWCEQNEIELHALQVNPLENEMVKENGARRCYHCKLHLMSSIQTAAQELGISIIADGTIADDFNEYRPGLEAAEELGIKHPLAEAKLSKQEVRKLGKQLNVGNWDLLPGACLATRIPTGTPLDTQTLYMIGKGEAFLGEHGIPFSRLRVLDPKTVKLEIPESHLPIFLDVRLKFIDFIESFGVENIYLDAKGYTHGAMTTL